MNPTVPSGWTQSATNQSNAIVAAFSVFFRRLLTCLAGGLTISVFAVPVDLDLPAQTADQALLAFAEQAHVEVLYSFDELQAVKTPALQGRYEPEEALARLLSNTGFAARRSRPGKFVVART